MAIPTNQTAATATVMTLPYTATQIDIDLATPTPQVDVWYSYTAVAGNNVLGMWAYWSGSTVNYNPVITVWTGPLGSLSQYLGIGAVNVPIQFPVTPGVTYYIRVRNFTANVPSAGTTLALSLVNGPNVTAPMGSILINDDTDGFPTAIISSSGGNVLQFYQNIVAGEAGDVLTDGTILLENAYTSPQTLHVYDNTLTYVGVSPYVAVNGAPKVRSHLSSSTWYVGDPGSGGTPAFVTTILATGALGPTTWTLPVSGLSGLAVNAAQTILYYTGQGGVTNSPIQRWNLPGNVALANLVAGIAGYRTHELIVLPDDTVLALYWKSTVVRDLQVVHYSTVGAVLNTYVIGQPSSVLPRLASAIDGTSFWVMYQDDTNGETHHFVNVRVVDGVVLANLTGAVYEVGVYQGTATPTPSARFGESYSCPFLILRASLAAAVVPPGIGTGLEVLIPRRLRRAPHLSTEQLWNFYHQFQLDLETGLGTTTGQGVDPQIMLRYSDDGGHTWSHEIFVSAGPLGQYRRRAIWRRLGRSRDRIFEISYSEPTPFRLINAYLQVTGGTS